MKHSHSTSGKVPAKPKPFIPARKEKEPDITIDSAPVPLPRQNLVDDTGRLLDPPTCTYLLGAQRFAEGEEIEFIQDVQLSYDEYFKLRRYVAGLRGLIAA
jgi:hypothetical protein